jgi:signal transduction histidine kinase
MPRRPRQPDALGPPHRPVPEGVEEHRLVQLGRAAGFIAHELNNLVTPVVSYAELALAHQDDPALVAKALNIARQNAAQAGRVAVAVLALARSRAFHVEQSIGPESLRASLAAAIETAELAMGRPLSADRVTLSRSALDAQVAMPQVFLDQVVLNILLNARAAMRRGGSITVIVSIVGGSARIVIEDTGPGFNAHAPEVRAGGGGLGLVFCSRVVEAFGGTFLVESQVGKGTRVTIVAPAARPARDLAA